MTNIPWTDESWNPVIGCTKIAAGCKNCYAERTAYRLWHMRQYVYGDVISGTWDGYTKFRWNGNIVCRDDVLSKPLHWRKPRKIFVCSMSDLFHEKVPFEFIAKVENVIRNCPQHTFQVLTKRPKAMYYYWKWMENHWPPEKLIIPNLWLGTSISTQADADKNIPILLNIPAAVHYVSYEPGLEGVDLRCLIIGPRRRCVFDALRASAAAETGYMIDKTIRPLQQVIIGCESGPQRRPCKLEWIEDVVDQCVKANVPVFVKQMEIGGKVSRKMNEWPKWAQRQEYPKIVNELTTNGHE